MRLERKKNTVRNAIWGIVNRVTALLGPFAIRTLIIHILGTEYLGLGSLFASILQVLNMAELGFSSAVAYCMYAPIADDDNEAICALLFFFRKAYRIVGLAIMGLGLGLMPLLPVLIKQDIPPDINLYILYVLYLSNTSISYLMCAYRGILFSGFQREDVISKIHTALLILEYTAQICVLMIYPNYYAYYAIVPIITIINNILVFVLSRKHYPHLRPEGSISIDTKKKLREKLSGIVISRFCGLTRNAFDSIVISAFIGLNAVAIYSNYYYILSNVSALLVILVTSMKAGIGNSMSMETQAKNHQNFICFSFMYMWIASWCTICLLCLYQPFMRIWVHEENMLPFYMVVLLALYFFGLCAGDIIDAYSGAAGLWWENRRRSIAEAMCNLTLNFVLGYYYGLLGIILATVITIYTFNFIWKLFILYRYCFTEFSPVGYMKSYGWYVFVLLINGTCTLLICNAVKINMYKGLMIRAVICVFIPNVFMFFFYHRSQTYKKAIFFLNNALNKRFRKE